MSRTTPLPGASLPPVTLTLLGGGAWSPGGEGSGERFTLLDFYRGVHCPRCRLHLGDLASKRARFEDRGVRVVAASMDTEKKAREAKSAWLLGDLDVAYGLSEADARALGLNLSDAIARKEPHRFSEPATMIVRPDGTLYSVITWTNPLARVHAADLLEGLDVVIANDYPARGTVA